MTQKEFKRLRLGSAQNAIIYRMLDAADGGWVLSDDMKRTARSLAISSRITDLRNLGAVIEWNRYSDERSAFRMASAGGDR